MNTKDFRNFGSLVASNIEDIRTGRVLDFAGCRTAKVSPRRERTVIAFSALGDGQRVRILATRPARGLFLTVEIQALASRHVVGKVELQCCANALGAKHVREAAVALARNYGLL